jgi:hypothetical protein
MELPDNIIAQLIAEVLAEKEQEQLEETQRLSDSFLSHCQYQQTPQLGMTTEEHIESLEGVVQDLVDAVQTLAGRLDALEAQLRTPVKLKAEPAAQVSEATVTEVHVYRRRNLNGGRSARVREHQI